MTRISRLGFALLVLFVLSGLAGLLYQSVWSHYLGLTLGHAAYAQTLVLAIFMGGMAIGAWLASRYSVQWRRLILGYAVVELVIGVFGLVFQPLFTGYTSVSQQVVLPGISSVMLAHGYQWLSAALLITPQSILLGATFPLMSAGLIRAMPNAHGEVLGGLYFTNSLGAAVGALLATFWLLPAVGLPGTVMTAGILNIVVAIGAWLLSKALDEGGNAPLPDVVEAKAEDISVSSGDVRRLGRVLVWSTAISGAASFVYEIGWVRMLNQAFGTTIHSFELMLSAFILGLAFGGLWIRKRAARIVDPVRYVGYVQVWMAIAALLSIPVFTQSFHWVSWIMGSLSRTGSAYVMYELATAAVSLLVMFPAAFLAGMTLPLFTLALLRAGAGERSIGRIYAANTLGAIAGVALAMHVLIPLIGVRLAVTFGALLDGLVGLYLLRVINPAQMTRGVALASVLLVTGGAASLLIGRPDPVQQVSGVFRTGAAEIADAEVLYLRDGKTATVGVFDHSNIRIISTNGKPDAGLTAFERPPTDDEITMVMAGVLPLALHPDPKRVAIIGWGSGLSTHTMLGSPVPDVVDTIEIEQAMVDGARLFGDRVERAYSDPRSNVRINDARTYFSTGALRYDVIVSEPSNPWVSGVASLFTTEFYAFLKRHLEEGGMLVQWLHTYEINDDLVATMLAALAEEFPHADFYLTNSADILVVARESSGPLRINPYAVEGSELEAELRRVGIDRPEHIELRRIGGIEVVRNFLRLKGALPHSDYFPTVSLQAPRTRFMGQHSDFLQSLVTNGMPVLDILDCRQPLGRDAGLSSIRGSDFSAAHMGALAAVRPFTSEPGDQAVADGTLLLQASSARLVNDDAELDRWSRTLAGLARSTIGHLPPEDLHAVWMQPSWLPDDLLQRPQIAAVMQAYSSAARRVPVEMSSSARLVLEKHSEGLSTDLREQMLVVAMLGALGGGNAQDVETLDRQWGPTLRGTGRYREIRSYLLAWADSGVPACAARLGATH